MRIQNNITAKNTHRQYTINNNSISKSAEKLSSGYRINRAGDDAAGLAISEKMRAQIRGLSMAAKNSNDAISLVQTAEGALQETHNILQRMRELAVQSASDTNETTIDRAALQQEFAQLQQEVDDIATTTRFNDQNVLDGTYQKVQSVLDTSDATTFEGATIIADRAGGGAHSVTVTVNEAVSASSTTGSAAGVNINAAGVGASASAAGTPGSAGDMGMNGATIEFSAATTGAHNGNLYTLKVSGSVSSNMTLQLIDTNNEIVATAQNVDFTKAAPDVAFNVNFKGVGTLSITRSSATGTPASIEDSAEAASDIVAKLNGGTYEFDTNGKDTTSIPRQNGSIDIEIDGETVSVTKGDTEAVFNQSGIVLKFPAVTDNDLKAGTNKFTGDNIEVKQSYGKTMVIQTGANEGDELAINITAMNTRSLGISTSNITNRENASRAITEVNDALNEVSTQRAAFGALQNRLEHKIANLNVSTENLTASESRIRDVDMAEEMTNFTKQNILSQAATAMLAQANALPQNVLSLLG